MQELYFKSLGNYDFCYLEQISLNVVLGEIYIQYITNIDMDNNIFISLKSLNEIRRNLVDKLIDKRQNILVDFIDR